MSRVATVIVCLIVLALGSGISRVFAEITLAADGRSEYAIVVSGEATETERTAAAELNRYLEAVTGARFPIVSPDQVGHGPAIYVGVLATLQHPGIDPQAEQLGRGAIRILLAGDDLLIGGSDPRATLHAVYTFLEEVVGIRWWTDADEDIPATPTLVLDASSLNISYTPPLQHRDLGQKTLAPALAAKLRLNGHFSRIPASHGGHDRILGWCHTFHQLLPPDEYFARHPEWYSLVKGQRSRNAQLCLTNAEMRAELTRRALEWIRKQPNAGIISISQNDHGAPCECETCTRLKEREGSESGPLIHFVNQVAADIAKEFPDVWVETLAYTYTRQPPRHVEPASNVLIRLAPIEALRDRPISDPVNAPFAQTLRAWKEVAPNLFIWDYTTNFSGHIAPHPNLYHLGDNIRFYVDHNAIGLFMQGNGVSPVGSFEELRTWVLGHLLWNPSLDTKALIRTFLEGYYKDAAPYLSEYLDLVHRAATEKRVHVTCYNADYGYMGLAEMNRATRLFADAEQAIAEDGELLDRVRRARLELDHLWLLSYWSLLEQAQATQAEFLGPADPQSACEAFLEACTRYGARFYEGDNGSYPAFLRAVVAQRPKAAIPPRLEKARGYVDLQDNQFRKVFNSKTDIVEDPAASDGWALAMSGDITGWVTRLPVSAVALEHRGPNRCFINARVVTRSSGSGSVAFKIGIYHEGTRKDLLSREVTLNEVGGDYQLIDLGNVTLQPGAYIWITGPGRSGKVETIYVDRVIFAGEL